MNIRREVNTFLAGKQHDTWKRVKELKKWGGEQTWHVSKSFLDSRISEEHVSTKTRVLGSTNEATWHMMKSSERNLERKSANWTLRLWLFQCYHPTTAISSRTLPIEELTHVSGSPRTTQRPKPTQSTDGNYLWNLKHYKKFCLWRTSHSPFVNSYQNERGIRQNLLPTMTLSWIITHKRQMQLVWSDLSWIITHKRQMQLVWSDLGPQRPLALRSSEISGPSKFRLLPRPALRDMQSRDFTKSSKSFTSWTKSSAELPCSVLVLLRLVVLECSELECSVLFMKSKKKVSERLNIIFYTYTIKFVGKQSCSYLSMLRDKTESDELPPYCS